MRSIGINATIFNQIIEIIGKEKMSYYFSPDQQSELLSSTELIQIFDALIRKQGEITFTIKPHDCVLINYKVEINGTMKHFIFETDVNIN